MTITPTNLHAGYLLDVTTVALFTNDSTATRTVITAASAHNTHTAALTFDIYIVPSGESVGAAYEIYGSEPVATLKTHKMSALVGQELDPGDVLYGKASTASKIACRISGMKIVS